MSEFLHVSLRSRDRDRTSEWYQKNVGFEEQRRGTTGIGTQTAVLVLPGNNTYIEVSDRVQVLRLGRRVATFQARDTSVEELVGAMTGALDAGAK